MIQVSINEKIGLEVNQPPVPFHRDDYICINCNGEVEHIYLFVRENSKRIKIFSLIYPNNKNISLNEIEFIASKFPIFEKYVYPNSGHLKYRIQIAHEKATVFVIIFCGYIFYFADLDAEIDMDPSRRITLLGIEKYDK